ncbi:hypothetical protein [Bradyrhizobium sp. HKCCYLS20291]|uniref:hypothetical protein n=1 Tax=Bradyrhizobium sp. HKCCYLS20291 TaxID=3420766 RepID=UPI003EC0FB70
MASAFGCGAGAAFGGAFGAAVWASAGPGTPNRSAPAASAVDNRENNMIKLRSPTISSTNIVTGKWPGIADRFARDSGFTRRLQSRIDATGLVDVNPVAVEKR